MLRTHSPRSKQRYSYAEEDYALPPQQRAIAHRYSSTVTSALLRREILLSGKQMDFWALALCSCFLTLLCHSLANIPPIPNAATRTPAQQAATSSSGAPAIFNLNLFTLPGSRPELEDESDEL